MCKEASSILSTFGNSNEQNSSAFLASKMVAPVMPSDEGFDYLPTQVVCDYLAGQKAFT